jgi:hypothetical protein
MAPRRYWPLGQSSTSPNRGVTINGMQIIVGATIWGLFCCFLLFPHLGLPAALHRAATCLLAAEFVLALAWGYGSEHCVQRPCGAGAEVSRTAITVDIPLLSVALVALAVIQGVRAQRRKSRV